MLCVSQLRLGSAKSHFTVPGAASKRMDMSDMDVTDLYKRLTTPVTPNKTVTKAAIQVPPRSGKDIRNMRASLTENDKQRLSDKKRRRHATPPDEDAEEDDADLINDQEDEDDKQFISDEDDDDDDDEDDDDEDEDDDDDDADDVPREATASKKRDHEGSRATGKTSRKKVADGKNTAEMKKGVNAAITAFVSKHNLDPFTLSFDAKHYYTKNKVFEAIRQHDKDGNVVYRMASAQLGVVNVCYVHHPVKPGVRPSFTKGVSMIENPPVWRATAIDILNQYLTTQASNDDQALTVAATTQYLQQFIEERDANLKILASAPENSLGRITGSDANGEIISYSNLPKLEQPRSAVGNPKKQTKLTPKTPKFVTIDEETTVKAPPIRATTPPPPPSQPAPPPALAPEPVVQEATDSVLQEAPHAASGSGSESVVPLPSLPPAYEINEPTWANWTHDIASTQASPLVVAYVRAMQSMNTMQGEMIRAIRITTPTHDVPDMLLSLLTDSSKLIQRVCGLIEQEVCAPHPN